MTVLVTGAGGGIGAAVVQMLADAGERVIAHDLLPGTDSETSERVARRFSGDLCSDACLQELRACAEREGISGVVAAHGIDGSGALAQITSAHVRRVMEINFLTVVRLYAAIESALAQAGGSFVAVSSANGLIGEAENSAYCASKFAIVGWARAMAGAAAAKRISLHVICPGCTDTPLLRHGLTGFAEAVGRPVAEVVEEYERSILVGRFAQPAEIAGAIGCLLGSGPPSSSIWAVTGGQVLC